MSRVKEAIEEMIEESYLMGLSEQDIRRDFKQFIDTCCVVIQENTRDRKTVNELAASLAREKTCILIADRAEGTADVEVRGDSTSRAGAEVFAEKVARRKRQILRTIAHHDPQLVRLIDAHRFQGEIKEMSRPKFARPGWLARWGMDFDQIRYLLLKVGYVSTIVLVVLLIYLGFIQKP